MQPGTLHYKWNDAGYALSLVYRNRWQLHLDSSLQLGFLEVESNVDKLEALKGNPLQGQLNLRLEVNLFFLKG